MLCNILISLVTLPLLISPPLASERWPCSPASSWPPSLVSTPTNAERHSRITRGPILSNSKCPYMAEVFKVKSCVIDDEALTYRTSLSSFPLGLSQQLFHTLQRVLQNVHLEQQSLSLELQPTQLLHHLVIAGLQIQLRHKHSWKSVWAILEVCVQSVGGQVFSELSEVGGLFWKHDNLILSLTELWLHSNNHHHMYNNYSITRIIVRNSHHFWESHEEILLRLLKGEKKT